MLATLAFALCFALWGLVSPLAIRFQELYELSSTQISIVSAYLTWTHVNGAVPVCDGGSGGCETVQTSRYAEILGVPVAALGLFAYATMLVCAFLRGEKAALSGAFVALVGVLFSA